jgi:transposase
VLQGKGREFNTRFLQMCSHHLVEPIACTPASGWEKGQVENQVDTGRCNFFTPLVKVENLEELNNQLEKTA